MGPTTGPLQGISEPLPECSGSGNQFTLREFVHRSLYVKSKQLVVESAGLGAVSGLGGCVSAQTVPTVCVAAVPRGPAAPAVGSRRRPAALTYTARSCTGWPACTASPRSGRWASARGLTKTAALAQLAAHIPAAARVVSAVVVVGAAQGHTRIAPVNVKAQDQRPDEQYAPRIWIAAELQAPALLEVIDHALSSSGAVSGRGARAK